MNCKTCNPRRLVLFLLIIVLILEFYDITWKQRIQANQRGRRLRIWLKTLDLNISQVSLFPNNSEMTSLTLMISFRFSCFARFARLGGFVSMILLIFGGLRFLSFGLLRYVVAGFRTCPLKEQNESRAIAERLWRSSRNGSDILKYVK